MATLDKEIEILMLKGQKGDTGRSIESIIKTSSSGDIDTYTITYTDGTTTTFDIENGVSSQDLSNALSPITSDITDLENGKVNAVWQSEYEVSEHNEILNNANGIEIHTYGEELEAYILNQSHQTKIESKSYNNGADDDTYQTNIIVKDNDIVINRDLGDGNESYSLFDMANKKLYRHIITLKGNFLLSGWGYQITLEVISNVGTQYTDLTFLTHFNLGGYLNCIGYFFDNTNTTYPILYAKLLTQTIAGLTFNYAIDLYYKDLSTHQQITTYDNLYDEVITIEL